jgi:autotransporter translocation and assembly factor TamB
LPLGRTIVGISDGELNGFFQDDRFDIRSVGARLGGSFVRGSGAVEHLFDPEQRHVLVDFDFNDVTVEPIDHLTLNLNGELSFRMEALQPARLEGDLEIKNALYEDTIKLVELVRALSRTLTGRGLLIEPRSQSSERSKNPLTFDIHVHAADNILFETNFAQAELRGDLRLTGDSNQPLLDGKIEAIDGVFGMQSNEFELISGQLNFSKQQKASIPTFRSSAKPRPPPAPVKSIMCRLSSAGRCPSRMSTSARTAGCARKKSRRCSAWEQTSKLLISCRQESARGAWPS